MAEAGGSYPPTKITPDTFARWMRILGKVDGSVLWLLAAHTTAEQNLRREAAAMGIAPARLIFAGRVPLPEYLARYRAADLFLDTLPYNAGATASDALWVGLPVLTLIGEAFPSRVAASVLTAIGMPDLITHTADAYEALAVDLATNPAHLQSVRLKLADNRHTMPLFDSKIFRKHLEDAYMQMVARDRSGLAPVDIFVSAASPTA